MAHDTFTEAGRATANKIVAELRALNIEAKVGTTYRDYGQNWTWETILVGNGTSQYQAVNPRDFTLINSGNTPAFVALDIVSTALRLAR